MLTFPVPSIFTVITEQIPSVDNDSTDALSRPSQFST